MLEFLHRVIDVLEEFLGSPLLGNKIEGAYDVVAQLLGEMCDAGIVCNTEPNALRDDVAVSGWVGKLLEGVGLPRYLSLYPSSCRCRAASDMPSSTAPSLKPNGGLRRQLALSSSSQGPAIPWRRASVRHTSNELYVDIIESLSVTLAPSGRPLAAFANGSILFNSKISGVPELVLSLTSSGGTLGMERAIESPVFHPCVRLARWKERPGELSFVPPDGRFMLAGYEVNLMPTELDLTSWYKVNLQLPISIEVTKSLGMDGADFEVRLLLNPPFSGLSSGLSSARPGLTPRGSGRSTPNVFGGSSSSSAPSLEKVVATIPVPHSVQNIKDIKASRGEAIFELASKTVEWRISARDASAPGSATLRCTVVGSIGDHDIVDANNLPFDVLPQDYDEDEDAYQDDGSHARKSKAPLKADNEDRNQRRIDQYKALMPSSASISFSMKGWLASGIKVASLVVDTKRSRGLGEGVKPYKGVKYLTVSKKGIETRC